MSLPVRERAPAKINVCLYLGRERDDGRHELVTLFDAVTLFDELEVAQASRDEVICEGVSAPNLVGDALAALRDARWQGPPVKVTITKRIPVAAGMGGGSADAAALLRVAARLAPVPRPSSLGRIARRLGADVPSQLHPGPKLGTGVGSDLLPVPPLPRYAVLVLPQPFALSTADVYREADRLALPRSAEDIASRRAKLLAGFSRELIVNDLQDAAVSLAPEIADALEAALHVGADDAIVCGSGPTVIGLFWGTDGFSRAREAAAGLRDRRPVPVAAEPVRGGDGGAAAK